MEFRLIYQGPLLADKIDQTHQPRLVHKQEIRRKFHDQLEELWKRDLVLNRARNEPVSVLKDHAGESISTTRLQNLGNNYRRVGINWVPLVNEVWGAACSLDILFLRREAKTGIVQTGDLDNRIKLLIDALRIPKENEFPEGIDPLKEPNPFFCLLSDDSLITQFRVTADRLLVPNKESDSELLKTDPASRGAQAESGKVYLVIEVKTFVINQERASMTFGQLVHASGYV